MVSYVVPSHSKMVGEQSDQGTKPLFTDAWIEHSINDSPRPRHGCHSENNGAPLTCFRFNSIQFACPSPPKTHNRQTPSRRSPLSLCTWITSACVSAWLAVGVDDVTISDSVEASCPLSASSLKRLLSVESIAVTLLLAATAGDDAIRPMFIADRRALIWPMHPVSAATHLFMDAR